MILTAIPQRDYFMQYLSYFKQLHVKDLIVASEPDPELDFFEANHINVHSIQSEDGAAPSQKIIDLFWSLFTSPKRGHNDFIAVACRRGCGVSPALAAIALINKGYSPEEALEQMRKYNPHFITERKRRFLLTYQPTIEKNECRIS
ncbi:protein tyrosine phosphatase, putative [Trichomonas vaginalis G3]|uniref:Protein tyrosine phosphatase, putative n=1 Tax=Trichomonas vaginalis (strain ATCC PRA-98 / G3) TaxID=412133 RepID=A2EGK1_TRIV3|nr:protein tyrosine phosphatase protein [Trichomonas vaginalis G3]EAY08196.1 protein tyrosine phosphatase, putative [Trichomonas vaginalis G3]KAI5519761.1 protein tyrosine phosphatase protein [Trichomonas vaginalis G3]|eukprot:XP_001320419.1 protein tyrosine phosphatase [Trichomonas vaginalis G3]